MVALPIPALAESKRLELELEGTALKVERREFVPVTFEMAKETLWQEVLDRHMAEKYREWMEDLRKQTYIERRGYFAEAVRLEPRRFD